MKDFGSCWYCGKGSMPNRHWCEKCDKVVKDYKYSVHRLKYGILSNQAGAKHEATVARLERRFERWLQLGYSAPTTYLKRKGPAK